MTSFISSIQVINVVLPGPNIFLWVAAFAADADEQFTKALWSFETCVFS